MPVLICVMKTSSDEEDLVFPDQDSGDLENVIYTSF